MALFLIGVAGPLFAQPDGPHLRLRSGPIPENLLRTAPSRARALRVAQSNSVNPDRGHLILQFAEPPGESVRQTLESRRFSVLAYVPDYALLVTAPSGEDLETPLEGLGVVYAGALTVENKLSPLFDRSSSGALWSAVVELHVDVAASDGRRIAAAEGLTLLENPDLPSHSLLVRGSAQQFESLASHDEVGNIYPASGALIERRPTAACLGGAVDLDATLPAAAYLASSFSDGWDGPGLGAASLSFNIGRLTPVLDPSLSRAEIVRAIMAWSAVVKVSFAESWQARQNRQLDISFADRAHGDSLDFDGRGGVLAHTFYPPPNSEPIAGDLHFDIEEQWLIGNDVDVFSVALHEIGHALGLSHNDDPDAVMYPYYRRATMLHAPDVVEIRKLYASTTETPTAPATPPPPAAPTPTPTPAPAPPPAPGNDTTPPLLVITTPAISAVTTKSATYSVRGRASDNVQVTSVAWSNTNGLSGQALGLNSFATTAIPLAMGQNRVTISAGDAAGNTTCRYITITRR
ncbi:MAG TPA: matrixin family metalloprotease [Paludibaculum sp.]